MLTVKHTNSRHYDIKECTVGSPKQIAWANQIKMDKITDIILTIPLSHKQFDEIKRLTDKANNIVGAKWWIDHRHLSNKQILKEMKNE